MFNNAGQLGSSFGEFFLLINSIESTMIFAVSVRVCVCRFLSDLCRKFYIVIMKSKIYDNDIFIQIYGKRFGMAALKREIEKPINRANSACHNCNLYTVLFFHDVCQVLLSALTAQPTNRSSERQSYVRFYLCFFS